MATDRRSFLGTIGGAAALLATSAPSRATPSGSGQAGSPERDFDFLFGKWVVQHRRLKSRLTGSTEWEAFSGTCEAQPLLGGAGNVDDNVLELPAGVYAAATIRVFNPAKRQWSIWWIDSRTASIDTPVHGSFVSGVGTFYGEEDLRGKPVKVRYLWSRVATKSAQWEQAFSPDNGVSWETNWYMSFVRRA